MSCLPGAVLVPRLCWGVIFPIAGWLSLASSSKPQHRSGVSVLQQRLLRAVPKGGPLAAAAGPSGLIPVKDLGEALAPNSSREGPEHLATAEFGRRPHELEGHRVGFVPSPVSLSVGEPRAATSASGLCCWDVCGGGPRSCRRRARGRGICTSRPASPAPCTPVAQS